MVNAKRTPTIVITTINSRRVIPPQVWRRALDVMRFSVPVQSIPGDLVYEAFTIQLDHQNEIVNLVMTWDKTRVSIPIQLIN